LWIDWNKQRFYEYDAALNKKTYAYGDAEIVIDPISKFKQKDGEPF